MEIENVLTLLTIHETPTKDADMDANLLACEISVFVCKTKSSSNRIVLHASV